MAFNPPRCKSCSKWKAPSLAGNVDLTNPPQGECHDRPPTVLAAFIPGRSPGDVVVKPFVLWPHTGVNDWCARHPDFGQRLPTSKDKEHGETYGRKSGAPT